MGKSGEGRSGFERGAGLGDERVLNHITVVIFQHIAVIVTVANSDNVGWFETFNRGESGYGMGFAGIQGNELGKGGKTGEIGVNDIIGVGIFEYVDWELSHLCDDFLQIGMVGSPKADFGDAGSGLGESFSIWSEVEDGDFGREVVGCFGDEGESLLGERENFEDIAVCVGDDRTAVHDKIVAFGSKGGKGTSEGFVATTGGNAKLIALATPAADSIQVCGGFC